MQSLPDPPTDIRATSSLDDQDLLGLYERTRESCYLEELVQRYHGLVVSVVRSSLSDTHDIQDAVQATFLILVKSALKIQQRQSLAAWLHGVAYRTARRIRDRANRERLAQDSSMHTDELIASQDSPLAQVAKKFQLDALDEELQRVRETYRAVLIEHYLLGKTAAEIAASCNMSQSTVEGRLRRGRQQLRMQMLRRGFGFSAAIAASSHILNTHNASAAELTNMANQIATYSDPDVTDIPNSISALVSEELGMSSLITSKLSLAILVGSITTIALGLLAVTATGGQEGAAPVTELESETPSDHHSASVNVPLAVQSVDAKPDNPASGYRASAQAWPSPATDHVHQVLRKSVMDVPYNGMPLRQLMYMLADDFNIGILVEEGELEILGVQLDQPITLEVPPTPLCQVLDYVLSPLGLSYRVEGEILLISSQEKLDHRPNLRVYDLSVFENPAIVNVLEPHIRAIQSDRWIENLWSIDKLNDQSLLVSAGDPAHAEIEAMLVDLARQLGVTLPYLLPQQQAAVRPPVRTPKGGAPAASAVVDPFEDNPFGDSQRPSKNPLGPGGGSFDPFGSGK